MTEKKPAGVQDWNIDAAVAMRLLGDLRRREDITLTPEEDAALGAGRLALLQMLPGQRDRVTSEMVDNALLGCPKHVREAMAIHSTPDRVTKWMLDRAMATLNFKFNKYRRPLPRPRAPRSTTHG